MLSMAVKKEEYITLFIDLQKLNKYLKGYDKNKELLGMVEQCHKSCL